MEAKPTEIEKIDQNTLRIAWSDSAVTILSSERLRSHCPCAHCREKRGEGSHESPILAPQKRRSLLNVVEATAEEALVINKIWAIGNYALGIEWGDGHSQGIYDWKLLRKISNT